MLLMKDIEALFTRKVAEYLADGYIFNTKTMSGSQVDLKKGKSFVRISLRILLNTAETKRDIHAHLMT